MDGPCRQQVEAARRGDREACAALFAAHWSMVHAWMLGFTRDRAEAEDLTQQAFLRAWTKIAQLREAGRFLPWLRTVARTVALGRPRRRAPVLRPEPVGDDPALALEDRERARRVDRALARLPSLDRSLLLLVYTEELPLARVAALEDMPVTTLRRRLADALARFRAAAQREGVTHELH
ncbi:MAG: sigma-70 family RNA polymerase sigma factor [Planctomycetota bacterium]